jgi:uncharacterized protein (DUF362 family)
MPDRRSFLRHAAAASIAAAAAGCAPPEAPKWDAASFRRQRRSRTAILAHDSYDAGMADTISRGLDLCGVMVAGKRVLIKPNLVEYDPAGVINTHPDLIAAAVEVFRMRGAHDVVVGEGPGHRRDNEYLLDASGLAYALRFTGARYVDLNTDAVRNVPLRTRFTELRSLYLPESLLQADLLVSMPKLKTHKWVGTTLSLKNMFGIIPGAVYGWPKNVLHWQGVGESILDINAALDMPRFNIVDGIVGMEGNGPIQGQARHSGVLVFGADPAAVDATCARLMGIDPERVEYLSRAGEFLGNTLEEHVEQVGEPLGRHQQQYLLLDRFAHLKLT